MKPWQAAKKGCWLGASPPHPPAEGTHPGVPPEPPDAGGGPHRQTLVLIKTGFLDTELSLSGCALRPGGGGGGVVWLGCPMSEVGSETLGYCGGSCGSPSGWRTPRCETARTGPGILAPCMLTMGRLLHPHELWGSQL